MNRPVADEAEERASHRSSSLHLSLLEAAVVVEAYSSFHGLGVEMGYKHYLAVYGHASLQGLRSIAMDVAVVV